MRQTNLFKENLIINILISNKMKFLLRFQSVLNYQYVFDKWYTVSNAFLINRYFSNLFIEVKRVYFCFCNTISISSTRNFRNLRKKY